MVSRYGARSYVGGASRKPVNPLNQPFSKLSLSCPVWPYALALPLCHGTCVILTHIHICPVADGLLTVALPFFFGAV